MIPAYTGAVTKERFLEEIKKHRKADMLVQGTYGKNEEQWRGCAVACSLRSLDIIEGNKVGVFYSQHKRYETELGIPEWLAHLEDQLFEGLPIADAMIWPERFSMAIPVGATKAQFDRVEWAFCAELMRENLERLRTLNLPSDLRDEVVSAIEKVELVYRNALKTGVWDEQAAESAAESAYAASAASAATASSAAHAAAYASSSAAHAAAYASSSSAYSAAAYSSAAYAATTTYSATAYSATAAAYANSAYRHYADFLVVLLKEMTQEHDASDKSTNVTEGGA